MADTGIAQDDQDGPITKLRTLAAKNPLTEQLLNAGEQYVQAKAENVMSSAGQKLGSATRKLSDVAEGGSLLTAGGKLAEGKSPARTAVEMGGRSIKDKIKDKIAGLFKRGDKGKGSGGGKKVINILEDIDVGVPLREAYDQWTEYQKFSTFAKGVTGVDRADDVNSNWKFKIFWSNRSMKATTTEQIPDERIAWTTDGAKGTIKGVVTFHPLGENLTKILMVIEYYPSGLFEKTGNIWRAQGRRARLDLKHFRRFIMMEGEATGEGWRGEIRDGEVVRTHEDAMKEEEEETTEDEGRYDRGDEGEEYGDEGVQEAEGEYDEAEQEEEPEEEPEEEVEGRAGYEEAEGDSEEGEADEDEYDEDEYDEDEYAEEAGGEGDDEAAAEYDEYEDEYESEAEERAAGPRARRAPARAR
jgi:uncharacterized membrane protein